MYQFKSSQERENFLEDRNLIYYKIVGGLGNQLFGLSSAHNLYRTLGKRIAIDVANLDHTPQEGPEWANWPGLDQWCELVVTSNEVPPEPTWNMVKPLNSEAEKFKYFTGWSLSLKEVLKSGLFKQGQLPIKVESKGLSDTAVHIRGGDYRNAKGIGLLGSSYYKKSIENLGKLKDCEFMIFTDDTEYASSIVRKLDIEGKIRFSKSKSAQQVMFEMSMSDCFIGSNSTLSWWAAFFSKSEQKVLPTPMYLQDWHADKDIILNDVDYVSRFPNKLTEISQLILWKFIRS